MSIVIKVTFLLSLSLVAGLIYFQFLFCYALLFSETKYVQRAHAEWQYYPD